MFVDLDGMFWPTFIAWLMFLDLDGMLWPVSLLNSSQSTEGNGITNVPIFEFAHFCLHLFDLVDLNKLKKPLFFYGRKHLPMLMIDNSLTLSDNSWGL